MQNLPQEQRRPRLLAVFAHPDDETFCAGGTLAKYVAEGWDVMVVTATAGQAGQIRDPQAATRRTLGEVRGREFFAACAQLGVSNARLLDYMDGTLQEVDLHELTGAVVAIIREFQPDSIITFGPDGAYGHPDHIAIGAATARAFEQAGSRRHFPKQISAGLRPHQAEQLYYSYFPPSRLQLGDRLAHWLATSSARFQGTAEFVRALPLFAEEATTLRYASDYVDVEWYPAGAHIVEQNEPGAKLYLILSGQAEVVQEDDGGAATVLNRLGAGEFFGELAIVHQVPRTAHVIAVGDATCLVLAPGAPSAFAGRGADARPDALALADGGAGEQLGDVLLTVDVAAFMAQKMAAVAAHRTQYPIAPDLLPGPLLAEMMGTEYFVLAAEAVSLGTQAPAMERRAAA
jgi:LmbE family N-acetylglucosaminyl deacetylase